MIRRALPRDYEAFASLFPELGTGDPAVSRERWQSKMMPSTFVSERNAEIAGYVFLQVPRGHITQLVVAERWRRQGIARELLVSARHTFEAAAVEEWQLNVKPDNVAALRLYESFGMKRRYASTALRFAWRHIGALAKTDALALTTAQAAALEATFALTPGTFAEARKKPGRMLIGVFDAHQRPVGGGVFDATFPNVSALRLSEPGFARAVLEAFQPFAQHDFLNLVVEDDALLCETLIAAGASLRFEMLHLGGPVSI